VEARATAEAMAFLAWRHRNPAAGTFRPTQDGGHREMVEACLEVLRDPVPITSPGRQLRAGLRASPGESEAREVAKELRELFDRDEPIDRAVSNLADRLDRAPTDCSHDERGAEDA
jgi:hypothetical protein